MSIRLLAIELYRVMKQVEQLEKRLQNSFLPQLEQDRITDELQLARAERDRIKAILEGAKEK